MSDNTTGLLNAERQNSGLVARELSYVLYKNRHHLEKLEYLSSLLDKDPIFNNEKMDYLTRNEKYQRVLQMAARVELIALENQMNEEDAQLLRLMFSNRTSCASPTQLHTLMFTKNIKLLFTDRQLLQWNHLLLNHEMIGAYAQTELGHGSNIRGLETTATYVPETDEFELHSPSLRSIKWWPGALSRTANFAIVYARLILHGRDYGVHNFMTQLRDVKTHERLPGIITGDIGAKIGFNSVDNGYCKFDHLRIPRSHMAMRFATVDRNGKYTKQKDVPQEILYFTMLQTRMEFVMLSANVLAKASTISIRYSAMREQGYDATNPKATSELPVLDYQTQMYRLFPLLATAYAITLTVNHMDAFRQELFTQIQAGNVALLNIGHAMSCGLKVASTDLACDGLEQARRACGGHGYLLSSGIPTLLGDSLQFVTAEGENHMLSLQTARSLLKALKGFRAGIPLSKEMAFMAKIDQRHAPVQPQSKNDWIQPHVYLQAFEQRFLFALRELEHRVSKASSITRGVQIDSVASYQLSMAYAKYLLVANFVAAVESPATFSTEQLSSLQPLEVVRLLCHLFALTQLESDSGSFMESGAVHPQDLSVIRAAIADLLVQIRPHAVVLVDAFNFSDRELNSALGRFHGRPYEALYESAQLDPVNQASDKIMLHEFFLPIRKFVQSKL